MEEFIAKNKKCFIACHKARTRLMTFPSYLMVRHPEIEDTAYEIYYTEKGEIVFRPCKEEK